MGAVQAAITDLLKAIEIAPEDTAANRRLLAWGTAEQRKQAALALSAQERKADAVAIADRPRVQTHRPRPASASARTDSITVIVPVYGDYDATCACILSLRRELNSSRHHAILINDATPDPRIADFLKNIENEPSVDVWTNARNLGFVGSVNRALEHADHGDVIILNSDTIVPRGFIDRLAAAARSSPDIGTATPLSNNGEFTSFPLPYRPNPLGSPEDIEQIDEIAARVNAGRVIDIPSGVGFCLYVTRACLDALGSLSEEFGAGYLEDADFCLRAREQRFRNVCVPSVYVGHAGTKSFGARKRALVVRNVKVIEQRFPKHRTESALFMAIDPLQDARAAIEYSAVAMVRHARLLVTGAGAIAAIARERGRTIASEKQAVLILEVADAAGDSTVKLFNAAGGIPQSLRFSLSSTNDRKTLIEYLKRAELSEIEILDPANVPFSLVELKVPYMIYIADAGLLGRYNTDIAAVRSRDGNHPPPDEHAWASHRRELAAGATRLVAPCPQAGAFAASVLPHCTVEMIEQPAAHRPTRRTNAKSSGFHLGFVPVRASAQEQWFMSEIAGRLARTRPDISLTVLGATLDDLGLMRSGNIFVTGRVDPREFDDLADALGVGRLLISTTRPLFGHPILIAVQSSDLPAAYFDWSAGRVTAKAEDLPLDPGASLDEIVGGLARWINGG